MFGCVSIYAWSGYIDLLCHMLPSHDIDSLSCWIFITSHSHLYTREHLR